MVNNNRYCRQTLVNHPNKVYFLEINGSYKTHDKIYLKFFVLKYKYK